MFGHHAHLGFASTLITHTGKHTTAVSGLDHQRCSWLGCVKPAPRLRHQKVYRPLLRLSGDERSVKTDDKPTIAPEPVPIKPGNGSQPSPPLPVETRGRRNTYLGLLWDRTLDTFEDALLHLRRQFFWQGEYLRSSDRPKPRLVILGTGWVGHAMVKIVDVDKYDVIVISPRNYFLFQPMLPSSALGIVEFRSCCEPILRANPFVIYYEAEAIAVDPERRVVKCRAKVRRRGALSIGSEDSGANGGSPAPETNRDEHALEPRFQAVTNADEIIGVREFEVPYTYCVVGVGSTVNTFNTPGVKENCFFLKEIPDARKIRSEVVRIFEEANLPETSDEERRRLLHFVVVGGGPTGVEFAGELHDFLVEDAVKYYKKLLKYVQVTLLQSGQTILTQFDKSLQDRALQNLRAAKINVRTGCRVVRITDTEIFLQDGSVLPYGICVWAAGVGPQKLVTDLIQSIPAQRDFKKRQLVVDDWLRVIGAEGVFAAGDCATNLYEPLPATAQVAGQQGAYLARLLNREYCLDCDIPERTEYTRTWIDRARFAKPFQFLSFGLLAYIGRERAMAQIEMGDASVKLSGTLTYLIWRSVYAVKQVSMRNRILITFDWIKAAIFGRDISQF
jgi:NADH:ubiquinone reductase (non-electrogenic)